MSYAPVEIRHVRLRRGLLGYRRKAVDRLLAEVTESFETVWRERADLADKVEQLEGDLVRFRELESLLRTTLVSAESASAQLRDQARREAELILREAHAEAREIQRRAIAENERLAHESRRLRAQLIDALSALDEPGAAAAADEEPEPATTAEQDADDAEERSWYGYPSGTALPDADAA